jgi:hypothetical protein
MPAPASHPPGCGPGKIEKSLRDRPLGRFGVVFCPFRTVECRWYRCFWDSSSGSKVGRSRFRGRRSRKLLRKASPQASARVSRIRRAFQIRPTGQAVVKRNGSLWVRELRFTGAANEARAWKRSLATTSSCCSWRSSPFACFCKCSRLLIAGSARDISPPSYCAVSARDAPEVRLMFDTALLLR